MRFDILKYRSPYFYILQIYKNKLDHMLNLVKPGIESRGSQEMLENIQRWEDDGGRVVEIQRSKPIPTNGHG